MYPSYKVNFYLYNIILKIFTDVTLMHKCIIYITVLHLYHIVTIRNNPLYNHYKLQIHVLMCIYNKSDDKKTKVPTQKHKSKNKRARAHKRAIWLFKDKISVVCYWYIWFPDDIVTKWVTYGCKIAEGASRAYVYQ